MQVIASCSPKSTVADDLRKLITASTSVSTDAVLDTVHSCGHVSDVSGMVHTPRRLTMPVFNHGNGEGALESMVIEIPSLRPASAAALSD